MYHDLFINLQIDRHLGYFSFCFVVLFWFSLLIGTQISMSQVGSLEANAETEFGVQAVC